MSSVYSLRPRPGALVSAPLRWHEVEKGITPDQFNLRNIRDRLRKEGDLWHGIFNSSVDIGEIPEVAGKGSF